MKASHAWAGADAEGELCWEAAAAPATDCGERVGCLCSQPCRRMRKQPPHLTTGSRDSAWEPHLMHKGVAGTSSSSKKGSGMHSIWAELKQGRRRSSQRPASASAHLQEQASVTFKRQTWLLDSS